MYTILPAAPSKLPNRGSKPLRPSTAGEEGAILLLVIWILALLSVVVLSWADEWRTEIRLAANFREARQCHRLAEAGVYYAVAKLTASKVAELQAPRTLDTLRAPEPWNGDQRRHLLELPGGQVEVRVADEAGKINLNRAEEPMLKNLLEVLGFPASKVPVMVDSILDWRSFELRPRPFGAKSDYYLSLDPPYPAKNAEFDTVEELALVRGFAGDAQLSRLSAYLTVQGRSTQINMNTAPPEVMLALGLPLELVRAIIQEREVAPLQSQEVMARLTGDPQAMQSVGNITFKSSPFFSILATGMIKNKDGARHTIKAVVQVDLGKSPPWKFLYWVDDYPG